MTAPDSTLPTDFADLGFGLNAQRRVLLVADMVESVRLMQRHEWETTQRWRSLVQTLVQDVLPAHQGTLVQRRGDGLMLEFETVTGAAAAAFECHRRADAANHGRPGDQHIVLRMGLHQAEVLADGIDLYGAGVQLTHRLAALAQPGETLCTAEVRDELTDGLHASVCDKGERLLPGQADPVRVYQLQPVGDAPRNLLRWAPESLLPRVAFVAAQSYANPDWNTVCQLVVTELTAAASRVTSWRVISALSTRRLTAQGLQQLDAQGEQRLADYVVQVAWGHSDSTPVISLRCTDVRRQQAVWQQDVVAPPQAWVASQEGLAADMARDLATTLLAREVRIAHDSALHSLPGYALLLAAMGLTHRTSPRDSERAGAVLHHLAERHPRSAEVRFWLGKWRFVGAVQGWDNSQNQISSAKLHLDECLEIEPRHAASMALRAHFIATYENKKRESEAILNQVINKSPNEHSAWIFSSIAKASIEDGSGAIRFFENAMSFSPIDPLDYMVLSHGANAFFVDDNLTEALKLAEASVRSNCLHLPGLAILMIVQSSIGQRTLARNTAQSYLKLRPNASVSRFLNYQTQPYPNSVRRMAEAMISAGIPT
jgi:adenylate cyclase